MKTVHVYGAGAERKPVPSRADIKKVPMFFPKWGETREAFFERNDKENEG